jgi:hypothetical protein
MPSRTIVSVVATLALSASAGYGGGGAAAPAAETAASVSYQGYAVVANRAERVGNVVASRGYRTEERLYAGEGHWLVTIDLRFAAEPAPASAAAFVVEDRTAYIGRAEVVLHDPSAGADYLPSSWGGRSWLDWSRDDEALKFNKERTKASKTYLFRVPQSFDRKAAVLKLGDQTLTLSFKRQKWDKD